MNLVASLVCRNEVHRYLPLVLENLLAFCDLVIVMDDDSDDGTREFLVDHPNPKLRVFLNARSTFYEHEGQTRQRLLVETLAHEPTHVLSVDADELVSDGQALRKLLTEQPDVSVWSLLIEEVWRGTPRRIFTRQDGGWRTHPMNALWKVRADDHDLRIMDRRLACRRVPISVWSSPGRPTAVSLLHFGWADPSERAKRYARYQRHDQGRFHSSSHLRSIMFPDHRVTMKPREWPAGPEFDEVRARLSGVVGSRA